MQRIFVRGPRFNKPIRSIRALTGTRKIHRAPSTPAVTLPNGSLSSVVPAAVVRGGC